MFSLNDMKILIQVYKSGRAAIRWQSSFCLISIPPSWNLSLSGTLQSNKLTRSFIKFHLPTRPISPQKKIRMVTRLPNETVLHLQFLKDARILIRYI